MPRKIYKWQKRNTYNNKHNFTKYVAGAGGIRCFLQGGGAGCEVTPLVYMSFRAVNQKGLRLKFSRHDDREAARSVDMILRHSRWSKSRLGEGCECDLSEYLFSCKWFSVKTPLQVTLWSAQWRQRVSNIGGNDLPLPFSPAPLPSSPLPLPSPPLPLEVGPLNPARGLGSAVSSPSGVWGGAPAEIKFVAF